MVSYQVENSDDLSPNFVLHLSIRALPQDLNTCNILLIYIKQVLLRSHRVEEEVARM